MDDDDRPIEYNFRVTRELEVNKIVTNQQDFRFIPDDAIIFNVAYRFFGQPQDFLNVASPGWLVCCWSVIPTLDLVLKDINNEGASLRFYNRVGEIELFHVDLGRPQTCDWVGKKLFIPEQVVYAFPRPAIISEFAEPIQLLTQITNVKANMCKQMRSAPLIELFPFNHQSLCESLPPLQKQKSLDPDHPFE